MFDPLLPIESMQQIRPGDYTGDDEQFRFEFYLGVIENLYRCEHCLSCLLDQFIGNRPEPPFVFVHAEIPLAGFPSDSPYAPASGACI